ncbi:helix-turn-helix domain-containing protein [Caldicellulosiruptor bescii]|nr:helix-turn-helix domain-containing protein [Caldicellulosiruptor bescii]
MEELEKNIADIKKLLLEMTEKETRDFLTVEELRKKYRVGKNFLYWLCRNNFVENRYLNRKYYISEKSFIEYLKNTKRQQTSIISDNKISNNRVLQIEEKLQKYLESVK